MPLRLLGKVLAECAHFNAPPLSHPFLPNSSRMTFSVYFTLYKLILAIKSVEFLDVAVIRTFVQAVN